MKNFKVLRRGFNWPIFIILFATLVVSGFFIFINNVRAATLEVTPTYTAERDIVVKATDRLIETQNNDGTWEWKNPNTNKEDGTGACKSNIVGITAIGLLNTYQLTGNSIYLDAAKISGDGIVACGYDKTDDKYYSQDIEFLARLGEVTGNSNYTSKATEIMSYFMTSDNRYCSEDGCTAEELAEKYATIYPDSFDAGIVEWQLASWVRAAQLTNGNWANDMIGEMNNDISGEAPYFDIDNPGTYGVIGLAGVIESTRNTDAIDKLKELQEKDGNWDDPNGEVQDTAYATIALMSVGETEFAEGGAMWLADNQDTNGGWIESDSSEYTEVDSETIQAIFDYIYVEDIYYTIQDAIDAATSGDTINVTAGTYDESVVINKNNLTISGDDSQPAITGGLKFDTDLTGLSLSNFNISGNAVVDKNSIVRMYGAITDLSIDNCVFDGEDISDRNGFSGGQLEGDVTIVNSEFKDILGWALLDSRSGSGGDGSAMGTVIFANNYVHDVEGSIVFRGLSTDWTDNVYIYGNTFEDVGKEETSSHWAAFEVNRAQNVEIYNNIIRDVVKNSWGEGQAMQLWQTGTVEIYDNTIEDNYQGIAILKWPTGETYDLSNVSIFNNSFSDNEEYALSVEDGLGGGPVNAIGNYWDDETGPGGVASGSGDFISENISYSPWYTDNELTSLKAPTDFDGTSNTVLLTQPIDIVANDITVSMPGEITITATASWEGIINAPSIETVALDTPTPESGYNTVVDTIIEIGYSNIKLVFNKAVRILIPDQAGKKVGYTRTGEPFTEITNFCLDDIQEINDDLPPEGDCKIDVDNDLAVWTKHFTQFIVYSYSPIIIGPTFRAETLPEPEPEEEPSALSEEAQKLDTNKDDKIDNLDLKELFANWGSIILDNIADFNNDSKVDVFDFNLLMVHWTE